MRNDNSTKFQLAQSINVKHNFESTKNEDYAITRRLFYSKDIHWFRYSQKKLDSFYPNRFIFSQDLFDASNADLYQYVERTFPDHAVDLVYEAGCCGFSAARYF
jgi:hypothetical protein